MNCMNYSLPWTYEGKNTGVVCHFLFQGIFPTQESNLSLLHWQADSLPLSHLRSLEGLSILYLITLIQSRPYNQSYDLSSSHVQMWGLNHKEDWAPKNWCFLTELLEKTLESPLDSKDIKPGNPKGNQPWISLEGLMLKPKLQYFGRLLWRVDSKKKKKRRVDSLEKTLMLGKIEGKRRRGHRWDG